MTDTADIVTVVQAAQILNVSPRKVRRQITAGTLPARKLGDGKTSAYVISTADLMQLVEAAK